MHLLFGDSGGTTQVRDSILQGHGSFFLSIVIRRFLWGDFVGNAFVKVTSDLCDRPGCVVRLGGGRRVFVGVVSKKVRRGIHNRLCHYVNQLFSYTSKI